MTEFIDEVSGIAKVCDFDVKFGVEKDVFGFDIAMGDSSVVEVSQGGDELSEDVACGLFGKRFSLVDDSEEFSVLFDLHDVVEDAANFPVSGSINAPHIEIDNLNDVFVFGFEAHPDLVQEHFQYFLLVASFKL